MPARDLLKLGDVEIPVADREQSLAALEHILATGDLAQLQPEQRVAHYLTLCRSLGLNSEADLEGSPEQVDDLTVQAPRLALRTFLQDCVQIRWETHEGPNDVRHLATPVLPDWYNSSRMVAECNSMGEVVVGEIRRCRDVGLKGSYRVIGVTCVDCGKARWTMLGRGKRALPVRCSPCQGARTHLKASAGNLGKKRPWQSERQRGARNPMWKGGIRRRELNGYIQVTCDADDPLQCMTGSNGYVLEHRLVMARALGRPLNRWEQVHHLNGIRHDNRLENLELWEVHQPAGIRQSDYHCPGCRCGERS